MRYLLIGLLGVAGAGIYPHFRSGPPETSVAVSGAPAVEECGRQLAEPSCAAAPAPPRPSESTSPVAAAAASPELLRAPRLDRSWSDSFFADWPTERKDAFTRQQLLRRSVGADDTMRRLGAIRELPCVLDEQTAYELSLRENDATVSNKMSGHPGLAGLPWRQGASCQSDAPAAVYAARCSIDIRTQLGKIAFLADRTAERQIGEGNVLALKQEFGRVADQLRLVKKEWSQAQAARSLMQILEAEAAVYRMMLVELLYELDGKEASEALAKLAVFDIDERVRGRAVERLHMRPRDEVLPTLIAGLQHIWAPAAWNAAQAIVAIDDRAVLPQLVQLLHAPNPTLPFVSPRPDDKKQWVVRELVRINHNMNCAVCHASTRERAGRSITGSSRNSIANPADAPAEFEFVFAVPSQTQRLSTLSRTSYYDDRGAFRVRLDVTYLRQDFSVTMPCEVNAPLWPVEQRYDFITRTRPATAAEIREATMRQPLNPHRDIVLFVLCQLTGKNAGDRAADWEQLLRELPRE
jgi:hypothetical protein